MLRIALVVLVQLLCTILTHSNVSCTAVARKPSYSERIEKGGAIVLENDGAFALAIYGNDSYYSLATGQAISDKIKRANGDFVEASEDDIEARFRNNVVSTFGVLPFPTTMQMGLYQNVLYVWNSQAYAFDSNGNVRCAKISRAGTKLQECPDTILSQYPGDSDSSFKVYYNPMYYSRPLFLFMKGADFIYSVYYMKPVCTLDITRDPFIGSFDKTLARKLVFQNGDCKCMVQDAPDSDLASQLGKSSGDCQCPDIKVTTHTMSFKNKIHFYPFDGFYISNEELVYDKTIPGMTIPSEPKFVITGPSEVLDALRPHEKNRMEIPIAERIHDAVSNSQGKKNRQTNLCRPQMVDASTQTTESQVTEAEKMPIAA